MSTPIFRPGRAGVPSRDDSHGSEAPDGSRSDGTLYPRRRPRWVRITLLAGLALLLVAGVTTGGAFLYYRSLDSHIHRTDAFGRGAGERPSGAPERPAVTVAGAQNFLLLGSDSLAPDNPGTDTKPGYARTDTIILMHVDADHQKAYLISLPRDLYVYIPRSQTNPQFGNTTAKINAAFAWGGVPLAVQTIEGYTGVHVDHVVFVDFSGFQQVTDALGGVDLYIEREITGVGKGGRHFNKGINHLDGASALEYVRQRQQFPDGDFARMRHQQQFLKALMDKATSTGTLSNPLKLNAFLTSVAKAMTVDNEFSLAETALAFRDIGSEDLTFLTSPNLGPATINKQSVVVSDNTKAAALYQAVARDKVAEWLSQNAAFGKPGG
jgi:LCP family protein required for cell wall assembly